MWSAGFSASLWWWKIIWLFVAGAQVKSIVRFLIWLDFYIYAFKLSRAMNIVCGVVGELYCDFFPEIS